MRAQSMAAPGPVATEDKASAEAEKGSENDQHATPSKRRAPHASSGLSLDSGFRMARFRKRPPERRRLGPRGQAFGALARRNGGAPARRARADPRSPTATVAEVEGALA